MPKRKGEPPTPLFSAPVSGLIALPLAEGEGGPPLVIRGLLPHGGEVPVQLKPSESSFHLRDAGEVRPAGLEVDVVVGVDEVDVDVHTFIPFII